MSDPKTKKTDASEYEFLNAVPDERKRQDSLAILELMRDVTGEQAAMWGTSIVGFGSYRYRYASGREGDAPLVGFAPRKRETALYLTTEPEVRDALLPRLGRHRAGASCVYIKRIDDVDDAVLRELIERTVEYTRAQDVAKS